MSKSRDERRSQVGLQDEVVANKEGRAPKERALKFRKLNQLYICSSIICKLNREFEVGAFNQRNCIL